MREMLGGKIHGAKVTGTNLHYEGSITIDRELMRLADILPYEKVWVLDVDNGARFETYAIEGGKGEIEVNGAAARLVQKGDKVIILSFRVMPDEEALHHKPRVVLVDEENRALEVKV